jgi:Zn-dependent protease with chaperone function
MAAPDEALDPIDTEPKSKRGKGKDDTAERSRKGKGDNGKPARAEVDEDRPEKGKKKRRDTDEGEARAERKERKPSSELKVGDRKVPYPPSPGDVPEDLTDYPDSYTKQQNLLLAGLFVFLVFYIGAVLFFGMIGIWCVWSLSHYFVLKVIGIVFSSIFFLFLVKGFFKHPAMNKEMHIEITEDEHPILFAFIEELCEELGAPLPNKVFVSPDVNAAVMPRTTLVNLFVEPKKDLLIGLGLVNSVNLSEFKAVLAHEFGHFSQSAMASSYTYVANRIIADLVEGEDWFDRMINWCKAQENVFAVIGYVIGAPVWIGRKILEWFYKAITLQRLAVSREREFHADLVAVSAAGSNAVVHCLLRTEFGHQCFIQALNDLATALDHKLYSNDLYLHQDRAAVIVRRTKKEPKLGLPPALKTDHEGKEIEVFDAEEEEMEDEIPPMWRTHPSNSDRERNAKEQFVPAVADNRSPWVLFDDPGELKERMTYKFYRMVFRIPKNADLADAIKVQKFIDNEHADTTYDPKYKGAYDDRPLEPGELPELNGVIRDKPWDDERMEKVLTKLYDDCEDHAEAHAELYKEMQALRSGIVGRPSPKMKRKMEAIEKKQDENWEWFKSFDRRVYLLHVQMAAHVDKDTKDELVERYRFQLDVQRLYQESRNAFNKADAYLGAYAAWQRGEINLPPDFAGEVIQVLREQWKALKKIIKDAREINLPAMKNFEENENLAEFILEGKMVPEPPLSYVKGVWIDKLMTQLNGVKNKCFRLHFKSVGGILRLQEEIAAKRKALREPIAAEVVEVVEEVIAAEVIPAEVIPAELLPAVPAAPPLPEPPKATAAFAPTPAPAPAPELRSPPPAPKPAPKPEPELAPAPAAQQDEASKDEPMVIAEAPAAEAKPPAAEPLAPADAGAFSLAAAPPTPAPVASAETFSLDADEAQVKAAAVTSEPVAPGAAEPAPAETVEASFSLDADDHRPVEPTPAVTPVVEERTPSEPVAVPPASAILSGVTVPPAPRNGATIKPANGKRPPLKITLVKPGETSPLAK